MILFKMLPSMRKFCEKRFLAEVPSAFKCASSSEGLYILLVNGKKKDGSQAEAFLPYVFHHNLAGRVTWQYSAPFHAQ